MEDGNKRRVGSSIALYVSFLLMNGDTVSYFNDIYSFHLSCGSLKYLGVIENNQCRPTVTFIHSLYSYWGSFLAFKTLVGDDSNLGAWPSSHLRQWIWTKAHFNMHHMYQAWWRISIYVQIFLKPLFMPVNRMKLLVVDEPRLIENPRWASYMAAARLIYTIEKYYHASMSNMSAFKLRFLVSN